MFYTPYRDGEEDEQVLPSMNNALAMVAMARSLNGRGGPAPNGLGTAGPPPSSGPGNALSFPLGTTDTSGRRVGIDDRSMGLYAQGGNLPAAPAAEGPFANMTGPAREAWGRLIAMRPDLAKHITSTYRSPEHNKRVGGANNSQHMHGNAFDLSIPGLSQEETIALIEDAKNAGFAGIGVYGPGTVHFDVGPKRAWGPSYGSDSIPGWARPYVY